MTRQISADTPVLVAVRIYYGLTQRELAAFLGVTDGQVAHAEAGRRSLATEPWLRLMKLAVSMPPPVGTGPPEPLAPAPAEASPADALEPLPALTTAERAALRRRLRKVEQALADARHHQPRQQARTAVLAHRRQALPKLQAVLAAEAATDPRTRAWLDFHTAEVEAATPPITRTPLALAQLALSVRLLELEETALRAWLGSAA